MQVNITYGFVMRETQISPGRTPQDEHEMTAFDLFLRTLREVRWKNADAVHNLWQTQFESPLLPHVDHKHNRRIEKLIECFALVEKDYRLQPKEIIERTRATVQSLRALGVEICDATYPSASLQSTSLT